ncbi:MAG: MBL fold metallo-hydrolase [Lachnospiraceae bacterium]|jgi:L-ascorbate metabolism protein UlaG (beta-lactamase superfamily)|nr:MBL fold metallo-hydrolase [Lachnospiraceae bacterium]
MTENITVFTQNSIRITDRDRRIYIDPFQMREEPHDADYILITHDHYDHFSPEDIEKVAGSSTILIVPEKMQGKADAVANLVCRIVTVKPGVYREIDGLEMETVSAYNRLKPFHPKNAEWVGYILRVDGRRIYIAGDTDATKEAKAVKCDIALVPVGGIYTMDAKTAAVLVNTIRPSVAIPVHYGNIVGKPDQGKVFADHVKDPVRVEFKISF